MGRWGATGGSCEKNPDPTILVRVGQQGGQEFPTQVRAHMRCHLLSGADGKQSPYSQEKPEIFETRSCHISQAG
jgi:hypothetical protein